jgi:diamine N-acetyltransferase
MLSLRPVLRDHVLPLIGLKVRADQEDLVSSNAKTLAEAAYETGSYVWGLWDGEALVGLMAMIHPGEYPRDDYQLPQPPDNSAAAAYLWRLMIGSDFQGKGYGAAALAAAFAQTRTWGYTQVTAHVSDAPHSNLGFYERFGFVSTGVIDDGELVICADVPDL